MSKQLKIDEDWLKKEQAKDESFVDNYKQQMINSIRGLKKEDIIEVKWLFFISFAWFYYS